MADLHDNLRSQGLIPMNRLLRPLALLVFAALCVVPLSARAELHLDGTRGNIQPPPIAIPTFAGNAQAAAQITQVLANDLQSSGLFKPIDQQAFIDKDPAAHIPPNYADWRVINAQALVTGNANQLPDGQIQVD